MPVLDSAGFLFVIQRGIGAEPHNTVPAGHVNSNVFQFKKFLLYKNQFKATLITLNNKQLKIDGINNKVKIKSEKEKE